MSAIVHDPESEWQVARECLRLVWQVFDHGGHSMGRSFESLMLETAMDLIPPDHRFSKLADTDREAFMEIAREARYQANRRRRLAHESEQAEQNRKRASRRCAYCGQPSDRGCIQVCRSCSGWKPKTR